jgi:hypothetical protein
MPEPTDATRNATAGEPPPARVNGTTLIALIDAGAPRGEIAAYLDALPHAARLEQVLAVTGGRVGRLFDAVAGGEPLGPHDLVPPHVPDGATVIHEGRNSLLAFSRFQKRFARGAGGVVVGFNHQTFTWFTGPGYLVVGENDPAHPGHLVMDYTREPPFEPDGWPKFKPNASGFSHLVYAHLKDYCRRVARDVLVGAAYKKGRDQRQYFSLVRLESPG